MHNEKTGTLTVTEEGLMTVFDARCADPGTLVRLSVYGEGKEGYLGVMEPEGGALILRRRLSRSAMAGFPEKIAYAAESGLAAAPAAEPAPPSPPETAPEPAGEIVPEPERESAAPSEPEEAPVEDILWYQAGDGSLFTTWNDRPYRAIPVSAWGLPMERALDKRVIDGVEYVIFPLDHGRII